MDEPKSKGKSVIVIGAGVGGVATAARLAKAGFKVTVLEKNDFTGGRCSLINHDGYRFDQGPSLLLLPRFFEEIFHDLGTSLLAEGIELLKCEPNYSIWFGDGSSFELSTDLTKMKASIEAVEEGIMYPKGGFHKVIEGLVKVGERLGVEYRLSTSVRSISIDKATRKANGVILQDGTLLQADIVVSNADLVYTYNKLLSETSYARSLSKREASCSSISFYWSTSRVIPELKAHNIFLADDYRESFDSIFKQHLIPTEPSFYVNVPSRVDPSAAPEGKDSIVVLVPVGHLLSDKSGTRRDLSKSTQGSQGAINSNQDWDGMVSLARETIISTIRSRIGVDLSSLITHEMVNTPYTWQDKFNLDKGAILGLSHSFFNVLSFRPGTQHSQFKNLYFVGASTHPGTGVPICIAGSKIVAEQILLDSGLSDREIPWNAVHSENTRSKLDRLQRRSDHGLLRMNFFVAIITLAVVYVLAVVQ